MDHADHCVWMLTITPIDPPTHAVLLLPGINMIRESIMCNADVTPNVYQWKDLDNKSTVRFDTIHTCRKWEPIHQWSLDHHVPLKFNTTIHVLDDLHFPDDDDR